MRSHGWSGNTPASDEEAISRILNAAEQLIAERGSSMRIADVARSLGVTRQTVYRYFPSTEQLALTTAMRSSNGFLDQLAKHVRGLTDPVAAMVEGMAFAVERLADDEHINLILGRRRGKSSATIASDTALAFTRSMLRQNDVDWEAHGFDEDALNELSEFCLRVLYSFLVDPDHPPRDKKALRQFLARWVGPTIIYPRFAHVLQSMTEIASPPVRRPRRRAAS